jgi:DNA-binding HxlR family transcriptional regulator
MASEARILPVRSYGQYCAVAKSLDLLGERWTLLIVRELMLRGPSRYTDLRKGLPGIATNLLAERLRELEDAGVVLREEAPPPIATTLYSLTPRGEELRRVIYELGRWGAPLMREPDAEDAFRSHWLWLPVELFLADHAPGEPSIVIQVDAGGEPMLIEAADGEIRIRPGRAERPDATLSGAPQTLLALLSGRLNVAQARRQGLQYRGDRRILERLLPTEPGAA